MLTIRVIPLGVRVPSIPINFKEQLLHRPGLIRQGCLGVAYAPKAPVDLGINLRYRSLEDPFFTLYACLGLSAFLPCQAVRHLGPYSSGLIVRYIGKTREGTHRVGARMVIRIFCKKIDQYDRERFDSFPTHLF